MEQEVPSNFRTLLVDFLKDLSITYSDYSYLWSKWVDPNVSDEELQEDLNQHLNQSSAYKLFDYYDVIFDSEDAAKEALSMLNNKKNWKNVIKEITKEDAKEFLITKQNANDIPEEIRELLSNLKEDENSNLKKTKIKCSNGSRVVVTFILRR